jgi:hypothetical protein
LYRLLAFALVTVGCNGTSLTEPVLGFLDGTSDNAQIGLVVNSLERSVKLFHLGDPTEHRDIALGESSQITPVALSLRGRRAVIPLGNAASVALVDLEELRVERFFLFPSGNATGSAFVDDRTIVVTNLIDDVVGLVSVDQVGDDIDQILSVAPAPASILTSNGRILVISSNLDENFTPIGDGVVTVVDPATFEIIGTVPTGGTNPQSAALGPDGLLYVVNTEDFVSSGSIAVIDPVSLQLVDNIPGIGVGPGAIYIDADGLAYVSGFFLGTVVIDTGSHNFLRGPDDPVCVRFEGSCLGVFDAETDADGNIYQVFFGSPAQDLPPFVYVFGRGNYELVDSVAVGMGASSIDIRSFRLAQLARMWNGGNR